MYYREYKMDGVDTKKSPNDTENDVGCSIKWHQRSSNKKKYDRFASITQQISSIDGRVCNFVYISPARKKTQ